MWQPIEAVRGDGDEKSPRDGAPVWLYCPAGGDGDGLDSEGELQVAGYWLPRYGEWFSVQTRWRLYREPTHWQPLPPPPGEG